MSYAKNPKAVKEVEKYLNEMANTNDRLEWRSSDPSRLSYQIRQGIAISERLVDKEPYTSYAQLKARFIIRVKGNKVVAEPRTVTLADLKQGMGSLTLPEGMDTLGIIGAAIEHRAHTMFFPEAEQDDLDRLYEWASKNEYQMVVAPDAGITLTKDDVGELAWQPST